MVEGPAGGGLFGGGPMVVVEITCGAFFWAGGFLSDFFSRHAATMTHPIGRAEEPQAAWQSVQCRAANFGGAQPAELKVDALDSFEGKSLARPGHWDGFNWF